MSVAELKQTVDTLSTEERLFLSAYLHHLARAGDPAHKAQLGERLRRMEAGKKVTLEQAQRLHESLESAGL